MSHLFAYLARMKFIRRWGLMHNTYPENIQEHSLRVAMIAHALAVIRNRRLRGRAAHQLADYTKCLEEHAAGNHEFSKGEKVLRESVEALDLPEVRYFLERFAPSFRLTLDELG